MIERASDLPKKHPSRAKVSEQILAGRKHDRDRVGGYTVGRSGMNYISELRGVRQLFDYARTLRSNKVLDIGAGRTRGAYELAQSSLGRNLDFEATVLTRLEGGGKYLPEEKVHSTSAEILRGIPDESVGCVIAVFSIAYSAHPDLAIGGIDRILVPGGVIKAKFEERTAPSHVTPPPKYVDQFYNAAVALGYDVAIDDTLDRSVMLAIKPDLQRTTLPRAKDLLESDEGSVNEQRNELWPKP